MARGCELALSDLLMIDHARLIGASSTLSRKWVDAFTVLHSPVAHSHCSIHLSQVCHRSMLPSDPGRSCFQAPCPALGPDCSTPISPFLLLPNRSYMDTFQEITANQAGKDKANPKCPSMAHLGPRMDQNLKHPNSSELHCQTPTSGSVQLWGPGWPHTHMACASVATAQLAHPGIANCCRGLGQPVGGGSANPA